MPTASIDATINIQIYILLRFKNHYVRFRPELIQKILKNNQIKKTQILYTRINSILDVLSIIALIPLVIGISTLTQTSRPLSVNTPLNSLISITTPSIIIRRKRSRRTLRNSIQTLSQQAKRNSLIQGNVQYIIRYLITTLVFQIARTCLNCFLTLTDELEPASYILSILYSLIYRAKLDCVETRSSASYQLASLLILSIVKSSINYSNCL